MKAFTSILLLLLPLLIHGQGVTQLADRTIYRGNAYSFDLTISQADSALTASARLYSNRNGLSLVAASQPTVSRSGRTVTFSWSKVQTQALPDRAFMEISAGGTVRFQVWVNTNKNPVAVTAPNSLTVVSPVSGAPPPLPAPVTALSIWQELLSLLF